MPKQWKASGSATSKKTSPTTRTVDGTGNARHLGQSTFHNDVVCTNADCTTGKSKITIVAANGDKVRAKGEHSGSVNHVTITGGTGRFAGASGAFTSTVTSFVVDQNNSLSITFTQWGTIDY